MSPRNVVAVTIAAFTISWGVCLVFGSGFPLEHDELNFLLEGLRLPAQGKLGGYTHGPLIYELMAAMEVAWYVVSRVLGHAHSPTDHLANLLANMGPHLKMGRVFTLLASVGCLVQVYRVGRIFAGQWAGALATVLCATSLTFGIFSSLIKDDVFLWLFLLTAMDLVWRSEPGDKRRPFLAGVAIGAAFATKYFAIFAMALALVPLLRRPRVAPALALRQGALMGAGAALGVLLLFPFLITDFHQVLTSVLFLSTATGKVAPAMAIKSYLTVHLPLVLGPVVGIAAIAELVVRCKKEPRGPVLLLVPAFLLLAFLGTRHSYTMSYHVYFVGIVAFLLAAAFAARVAELLKGWLRALPYLALIAVVLFHPSYLWSAIKYGVLVTGPDTRAVAADRIRALVPANECVVLNGGVSGWNHFGPAIPSLDISPTGSTGAFAAAERASLALRPGPHYKVVVSNEFSTPRSIPATCQWLVVAREGTQSLFELGPLYDTLGTFGTDDRSTAPGFTPVAEVHAVPEQHSIMYPYMTSMDLDELRAIPLGRLWRERNLGPSFQIYRRTAGQP